MNTLASVGDQALVSPGPASDQVVSDSPGNRSFDFSRIKGKRILVVGLGRTGLAAARFLSQTGAHVTVSDSRPPADFQAQIQELVPAKVALELGRHSEDAFSRHDLIVVSPGVDVEQPLLREARERGIPLISEIEIASWFLPGRCIGVTGSNGKTTTVTLLGKVFEDSGFAVRVGGNIGAPLISQLDGSSERTVSVVELSSFQLQTIERFRPTLSVLLNLTPDHLDRHGSFEQYVAAKANIFRNQGPEDTAVLNADDPEVMKLASSLRSRVVLFSLKRELLEGVFVQNGNLVYRSGNLERELLKVRDVRLRGLHNLENVLAAAATACILGVDFDSLRETVSRFTGVEHRLEFVREIRGVSFFNDSKATNVDAAGRSVEAMGGRVHVILGGQAKGGSFLPLSRAFEKKVKAVYLIGSAADRIAGEVSGSWETVRCDGLKKAVEEAFQRAKPKETVLLAPACASFDQFRNFEHRGRVFKDAVKKLAEKAES